MKTVDEKDQWFFDAMLDVPRVNPIIALLAAPLNLLLPGIGIILCALFAMEVEQVSKI